MNSFDHPYLFLETAAKVDGKTETVRLISAPMLWKPLVNRVLFIWALTSCGPLVLMSSELTMSPRTALELYCARTRIEIMFATLKQLIGAFRFRFWLKTCRAIRAVPSQIGC